jgi:hypothetical protein
MSSWPPRCPAERKDQRKTTDQDGQLSADQRSRRLSVSSTVTYDSLADADPGYAGELAVARRHDPAL